MSIRKGDSYIKGRSYLFFDFDLSILQSRRSNNIIVTKTISTIVLITKRTNRLLPDSASIFSVKQKCCAVAKYLYVAEKFSTYLLAGVHR